MSYTVSATDLKNIQLDETDLVADVLQNIAVILATPKGSVPLYREFGLSAVFLDKPVPKAKMMMIAEIKEAIKRWEPRVEYVSIQFTERITQLGMLWPTVEVEIIGD